VKILLDECIDIRMRPLIPGHEVFTVRWMGWSGMKNGQLVQSMIQNQFEVLVTLDQLLSSQQSEWALRQLIVVLIVGQVFSPPNYPSIGLRIANELAHAHRGDRIKIA
jgi:hypothetical protein